MTAMNVGFHFVPRNGELFLFHREYGFATPPDYCQSDYARIVVRKSTNRGETWSDPIVVASPGPEGAPDECALTDGAGYYDEETSTWHYLSQCLDRDGPWNLCHYYLVGIDDPTTYEGAWLVNEANPVVKGGDLWSQICNGDNKHCPPDTHDEGTPEIVKKDDQGYYFVTFHGCNKDATVSARGVAKTMDFVTWETSGDDLPNDAIFGQIDCNTWNIGWVDGTCVGGGEGSILYGPDGYMYQLIEAPDISLSCKGEGQNWVLGLTRSNVFSPAGTWEGMNPVPTMVPPTVQGCYIQYHRIFTDGKSTFLEYW